MFVVEEGTGYAVMVSYPTRVWPMVTVDRPTWVQISKATIKSVWGEGNLNMTASV